jgi:hypothetical protein
MFPFGVTIPASVPQRSEIPEELINYPVFVAVGIQHVMRTRHIVFCGVSGSKIFFHIVSYTVRGEKKAMNIIYFDFLYKLCLKHFSLCEELSEIRSKPYFGSQVKYYYSC